MKIWTIFNGNRVVGNKRLPLVVYICVQPMLYPYAIGVGRVVLSDYLGSPEPSLVDKINTSPRLNRNVKYITLIIRYAITETLWIDTIKLPLFLFSQEANFYSNICIVGR